MTYEEFINQELAYIGIDSVDELFALGFEPAVVSGRWKWVQRVINPNTATSTQAYTSVNVVIPIN